MDDDEKLLAQAIDGDEHALTELLERTAPRVRAGLRIGTPFQSVVSADDIMQVTYIEAFLRIGRFKPENGVSSFEAWLHRLAENNRRDACKKENAQKRRPPGGRINLGPTDDSHTSLYVDLGGSQTTPSRALAREEIKALLEAAIGQLPPDYAEAVRLCDLEGLTAAEVAARTNRNPGAVRVLRLRARERLKEILGGSSKYFSDGR